MGKSIKLLVDKYTSAVEKKSESVFDEDIQPTSTEAVFEKPFEGEFNLVKHYDLLWVRDIYQRFMFLFASPFNILRDANTQEIAYRDSFVNPFLPKVFDDMLDKVRFQVGEIESSLCKQHRNETNGRKPRVNLGSKHDGILKIYMNATEMEIGFLEVVGNAVDVDVTGYYGDMEKLFKVMQISIFYQRQHHLERNATENQLLCLQSFGVLVYQRETTIYTMHRLHRAKGRLHIVDIITNFTIPDNKDQAYVIDEIIEKVYFFKSRVMDYYLKLQEISRKAQKYSHTNENPL